MKHYPFSWMIAILCVAPSFAQILNMGPHDSTCTGFTRGHYFAPPVDMTITGAQVLAPPGVSNAFQYFAIIRFEELVPSHKRPLPSTMPGSSAAIPIKK